MAKDVLSQGQQLADFRSHIRKVDSETFETILEVAAMQMEHPDHENRCWAGTRHNIPFLEVLRSLNEERRLRGITK